MAYRRIVAIAIVLILITACGRRLPEESLDESTTEDNSAVVVASPTVAESIDENTDSEVVAVADATADAESTPEDTTVEELETEEPVAVVEAEPADELITVVADANADNGETLFNQMTGTGFACATCHNAANDQRLVGPGFAGLPMTAENRLDGVVAERYLYNSIIHPNDYVVESYPESVMPPTYEEIFSEDELHDLVAYLMTLGEMPDRSASTVVEANETEQMATDEPMAEPTVVADASTDTSDNTSTEPNTIVITQIVIVTATPMAEAVQETEAPVATATVDPNATPDFIVTLSSFGRISNGETLYANECLECHTLDGSGEYDLSDLATLAGDVAPERYLYDALNAPDVHDVVYTETLSEIELYDLIAYLVAQSGE